MLFLTGESAAAGGQNINYGSVQLLQRAPESDRPTLYLTAKLNLTMSKSKALSLPLVHDK